MSWLRMDGAEELFVTTRVIALSLYLGENNPRSRIRWSEFCATPQMQNYFTHSLSPPPLPHCCFKPSQVPTRVVQDPSHLGPVGVGTLLGNSLTGKLSSWSTENPHHTKNWWTTRGATPKKWSWSVVWLQLKNCRTFFFSKPHLNQIIWCHVL